MDYVKHNKEEHQKAKDLMKKIEKAKSNKKDLFRELFVMIYAHHTAEEETIFPILKERAKKEDYSTVLEMIEEHNLIKYQFSLVERTSEENESWDAKFSVLSEIIEHHLDEEETDLSPVFKDLMTKEESKEQMIAFEEVFSQREKEKKKELGIK